MFEAMHQGNSNISVGPLHDLINNFDNEAYVIYKIVTIFDSHTYKKMLKYKYLSNRRKIFLHICASSMQLIGNEIMKQIIIEKHISNRRCPDTPPHDISSRNISSHAILSHPDPSLRHFITS